MALRESDKKVGGGGGGEEAGLTKISKLVLNKWILDKAYYLVPLDNNIKCKMISGVNCTHI